MRNVLESLKVETNESTNTTATKLISASALSTHHVTIADATKKSIRKGVTPMDKKTLQDALKVVNESILLTKRKLRTLEDLRLALASEIKKCSE